MFFILDLFFTLFHQNTMLEENLCRIGLTKRESRLYIELLKLGSQAVSVVAQRLGFKRTSTYSLLNSLLSKGLVSTFTKNNIRFFSANDPNCLVAFLDCKSKKFDFHRSQILSIIPKIRDLIGGCDFKKPLVSYYDGLDVIKFLLVDLLGSSKSLSVYLPSCGSLESFLFDYFNICLFDKELPLRVIASHSDLMRDWFIKNFNSSLFTVNFMGNRDILTLFRSIVMIFDNHVFMINIDNGLDYAVLIRSDELVSTQKAIFDLLWNINVPKCEF